MRSPSTQLLKECDVKESVPMASPSAKKIASTTSNVASTPKVHAAKAEKEDPPGAATLKMILQLAVLGLFADGYSRLRKQEKEKPQPLAKKLQIPTEEDKSALKAWTEMVAAASDADEICFEKALCSKPALNQADPWGCTPLHFAAKGGSTMIVSELLKRGAQVNAIDAMDETPLHFAARAGHVEICEALLAKGATKDALNVQDFTPLVVAGHAKQASTVSFLVEKGAGAGGLTDEALPLLVVSEIMKRVFAGGATSE